MNDNLDCFKSIMNLGNMRRFYLEYPMQDKKGLMLSQKILELAFHLHDDLIK